MEKPFITTDKVAAVQSQVFVPDYEKNIMIGEKVSIARIIENVTKPLLERIQELENLTNDLPYMNEDFGKILLSDGTSKVFVNVNELNSTNYPVDSWDAIGIVVIPSSHNVYNMRGKPGIMSLKYARYDNPDNGGNYQSIVWGEYGLDFVSLYNFKAVNIVNNDGIFLKGDTYGCLPSDKFSGTLSPDGKSKWNSTPYCPSPYNSDGTRNLLYCSEGCIENALGDFNGYRNTKRVLDSMKDKTSWKTGNITNEQSKYPAFTCSWRYKTKGTNSGDWYLPACGELGYVCNRQSEINTIITKINSWKSGSAVTLGSNIHWSSSEYDSNYARNVSCDNGYVDWYRKGNNYYVRPFLWVV